MVLSDQMKVTGIRYHFLAARNYEYFANMKYMNGIAFQIALVVYIAEVFSAASFTPN